MRVDWDNPVDMDHPLNRGLVAWWMAGEGPYWGGPLFRDLVPKSSRGGGNHGTLTNGPTWGGPLGAPGQFGRLTFNGTSNYVSTGITSQDTDFSCEVIFNGTGTENHGRIVDKNFSTGFAINRSGTSATDFTAYILGTNIAPIALGNNAWHQLVLTRSGTTGTLYANGGSSSTTATVSATALSASALYIGVITGNGANWWSGSVAAVRYFNRALSASEVRALHDDWRQGYPLTINRVRPYSIFDAGGGAAGMGGYVLGGGFTGGRVLAA